MKSFDDIEIVQEVEVPIYDRYALQKQRLLFNVTRSDRICSALSAWLQAFEGGMSKKTFMEQVSKLDFDDEKALQQIEKSKGKRSICMVKAARPPLPPVADVVQLLAHETLFIAVNGKDRAIKEFVRNTYQTLKTLGRTFVLDLDELRMQWTDRYQQGRSKEICQQARDSEFLIILGLEAPSAMPNYIVDWVNSLRRYRVEKSLPMIVPFARCREKDMFFIDFKKFSV